MTAPGPHTTSQKLFAIVALVVLAFGTISVGAVTFTRPDLPFADEGFGALWTRTDAPAVRANRPFYWGERPWWSYAEFYRQGANGLRTVQYFDKGRMQLDPADRSGQSTVASGPLVSELVTGRIPLGSAPDDVDLRAPAPIPVVGDLVGNREAPTYATFAGVTRPDPDRVGQLVDALIDADGTIGRRPDLAMPLTTIVQYDAATGHNIPSVFWQFIGRRGMIQQGTQVSSGLLIDWLAVAGHPISDPYWARAVVGGVEREVLVQLFAGRVLTYTPGNPPGYEVELGNVGQHYVAWRYPHLGQPWAQPRSASLVYAVEDGATATLSLRQWTPEGGEVAIPGAPAGLLPFAARPGSPLVVGESAAGDGIHRQLYAVTLATPAVQTLRLTYSDGAVSPATRHPGALPHGAADEYHPAVSPDGTKIAFVSNRSGSPELFLMPFEAGGPVQLTSSGCVSASPIWSPDGRALLWAANCDGDYEIYRGELAYYEDGSAGLGAALINVQKLTDNTSDDRSPHVAPDGQQIAFVSSRTGIDQVYIMKWDGTAQQLATLDNGPDATPAWSPDGTLLAFSSKRTGTWQIFTLNITSGEITQITEGEGEHRQPTWVG